MFIVNVLWGRRKGAHQRLTSMSFRGRQTGSYGDVQPMVCLCLLHCHIAWRFKFFSEVECCRCAPSSFWFKVLDQQATPANRRTFTSVSASASRRTPETVTISMRANYTHLPTSLPDWACLRRGWESMTYRLENGANYKSDSEHFLPVIWLTSTVSFVRSYTPKIALTST